MANLGKKIEGFPQSSNEYESWQAQGRTFDLATGSWYEKSVQPESKNKATESPFPTASGMADIGEYAPNISDLNLDSVNAMNNTISRTAGLSVPEYPSELADISKPVDYSSEKAEISKALEPIYEKLKTLSLNPVNTADELQKQLDLYGVKEDFTQLRSITQQAISVTNELVSLRAEKQAALLAEKERMAGFPGAVLSGELAKIENDYFKKESLLSASLSAFSAQGALLEGNINLAQSLANNMVSAMTYDAEQNWKSLTWMADTYQDLYQQLDDYEKEAWNEQVSFAQSYYDEQKKNAEYVAKIALDPNYAKAFLGYDISQLTPAQAVQIANNYAGSESELLTISEAAAMNLPYGTTKSQAAQVGVVPEYNQTKKATAIKNIDFGTFSVRVDTNNINSSTIQKLRKSGMIDSDIYSWLDLNTNLTAGSIDALLSEGVETGGGVIFNNQAADDLYNSIGAGR